MTPRIEPLPPTGNRPDIQELLDISAKSTGGAANVVLTMARHPGLFRKFVPFSGKLLVGGKLAGRDRELLILRTAWRCGSDYEWGQHARIGAEAGLTADEIARVGGPLGAWEGHDRWLLAAADQLLASHRLDDATWAALAAEHDEPQLIEILMLPGAYAMLAGFLNTVGVEREPGVVGLPG